MSEGEAPVCWCEENLAVTDWNTPNWHVLFVYTWCFPIRCYWIDRSVEVIRSKRLFLPSAAAFMDRSHSCPENLIISDAIVPCFELRLSFSFRLLSPGRWRNGSFQSRVSVSVSLGLLVVLEFYMWRMKYWWYLDCSLFFSVAVIPEWHVSTDSVWHVVLLSERI